MKQHPFITELGSVNTAMPSQNVSLKIKKTKEWKHGNMDFAEFVARDQYLSKQKLLNDYKWANAELTEYTKEDAEDTGTNFSLLDEVQNELALPGFMKNYDIITQPLAKLEAEMDSMPDVFTVKGKGDIFENEKLRVKTKLLQDFFESEINRSIEEALAEMVEETPEWDEIAPEQQQAKQQQVIQEMTPASIEKYMTTSYKHILELWGQFELEDQFERFRIKALRRKEFQHFLRAAQRFRHLYTGPKGLKVETLNPIHVAILKSPSVDYVQDGDLAAVIQLLSIPAVIDRYGHLMTDKELNSLEAPYEKSGEADYGRFINGDKIEYNDPRGIPYQTRVPTLDPYFNKVIANVGYNPAVLTEEDISRIDGDSSGRIHNMLTVVTAYWRSQKRIGKLTWISPETGLEEILLVDENFVVPQYIKQIKDEKFDTDAGLNTLIWTRETEIWQGIKISGYNGVLEEPLYLDIKPAEIQIGKLLIAGQFANDLNTKPSSLVSRLKPYGWFHNVLWNQCYHYIETEILPFALFASDMIPGSKDWGGEDGLEKWITLAQATGIAVDENKGNLGTPTQNLGGQYPKIVDLDRGTRVLNRLQLAIQIKQLAWENVGMSPQSMGVVKVSETATGIQQAQNATSLQTSVWATSFLECEKDILQMQLNAAKQLQAQGKQYDIAGKSELSLEALRLAFEDGDLYDLHVYVVDSQKELRDLQLARQLALENNTSDMQMSDRILTATASSINEIIVNLKQSEKAMIERQQQQMQLEQQKLEQQGVEAESAREMVRQQFTEKLLNNIDVALINAEGREKGDDMNANGISDIAEYYDMIMKNRQTMNQNNQATQKLDLDKMKEQNTVDIANKKLKQEERKMAAEFVLGKQKIEQARIQGDKSK